MSKSNFTPKYQRIINDYQRMIEAGELKPGDKLPSREELVKQYQVTNATVNRAMSELLRANLLIATPRNGTYVADPASNINDKVALVVNESLLFSHSTDWSSAQNYYAMFGSLLGLIPEEQREIISFTQVQKAPNILKPFKRILVNNLPQNSFENAVKIVGDRSRFLLLNRYYENCNFVSINHHKAAFDLAESLIQRADKNTIIGLLDMPLEENISNRFVWLERRAGFMDACEKHNRFFRIVELNQDDYVMNQKQLKEFDARRKDKSKALLLSPSKDMIGFFLGFLRENNYKLNEDYLYGDFDNTQSLQHYGIKITSVVEDYKELASLIANNLWKKECKIFIEHKIIN